MNTPGVSIFQGTESIQINTSIERAEEEEALEDQRRRNEELGNLLQNAFDDLDDGDSTIDSTANFRFGHAPQVGDEQDLQSGYEMTFEKEIHQLKMLVESKSRELVTIQQMANDEYKKRDETEKRLKIAEAELDRTLVSKRNTHELLVECKEKCSNLESTIEKCRTERKALESENNTLVGKVETLQTLLADTQRKYDMVERDLNRHNDRNAELKRKQMEERHRAEIEMLQQQMDQINNKLAKKSNDVDNMNTRYKALQDTHEKMLIEKASKISELNNLLDETQNKCQELMAKQDYFQENVRLQKLVASLQNQIQDMERTIASLNQRLEFTTNELDVMDNVLHQHNMEDACGGDGGDGRISGGCLGQMTHNEIKFMGSSTPIVNGSAERVTSIKSELYRALANVKSKRDEIRRLQRTLDDRNAELHGVKDEENRLLVQLTEIKEDKIRLENRAKLLDEEAQRWRAQQAKDGRNRDERRDQDELKTLREEKLLLQQQQHDFMEERDRRQREHEQMLLNLNKVRVDLVELRHEHDVMKRSYDEATQQSDEQLRAAQLELEKYKFLLKDAQTECDRLKGLYVDISNAKEAVSFELEKLRSTDNVQRLKECQDKVENMTRAVQLAELKASEMVKILDAEKTGHEREVATLKEKLEREKLKNVKDAKDTKDIANNCKQCIEYLARITTFEIEHLRLTNDATKTKKDIDELTQKLHDATATIGDLSEKLALSEQQEQLIRELKAKACRFEEYIKGQSSSSDRSPTPKKKAPSVASPGLRDKSVSTSPELEISSVKMIEARIREEMATIFAIELKRYQVQTHDAEKVNVALQNEYKCMHNDLKQRQYEVDVLKKVILAERERFAEILNEDRQKQNVIGEQTRAELQERDARIANVTKELEERQSTIEAERKSMKAVMIQWEEQRKNVDAIESEWRDKVAQLKAMHTAAVTSWQTKYNSAKRTAANYKRYAEDKEAHMLKEYERIKGEYDASLAKFEVTMREAIEKRCAEAVKKNNNKDNKNNNKENRAIN